MELQIQPQFYVYSNYIFNANDNIASYPGSQLLLGLRESLVSADNVCAGFYTKSVEIVICILPFFKVFK